MLVSPDESWSSNTEIFGYDEQICLGTFPFLWPFVRCPSKITVEGYPRSWKSERTRSRTPRSRRLRKTETRSGTQPDGSIHPGLGLFHRHLLPGKNGAQTRHIIILIGSLLIGTAETKCVRVPAWHSHFSWQWGHFHRSSRRAFMTSKITSVCDGVHLFAISAPCLVCCERRVRLSWFSFMQQAWPCECNFFWFF